MSVINMLIEEGALVRPGAGRARRAAGPTRWSTPGCSTTTAGRVTTWRRSPRRCDPDDVVLDIGTGSGVLAVAAARAGARHVYAVEASDIAEVAERVFAVNGVQDRVTLLPGWSRQIELPEPADLLVAEVIGNEPLEEEILETTLDARRRLLKPGARLIPHTLTLSRGRVLLPEAEARQRAFGRAALERWRRLVRHRLPAVARRREPRARQHAHRGRGGRDLAASARPSCSPRWTSPPSTEPSVRGVADLVVDPPGAVNAVAVTFRAELYGAIAHTLDPWTWPASSWATSVWVLPEPVEVGPAVRPAGALPPSGRRSARRAHLRGRWTPADGDDEITCSG